MDQRRIKSYHKPLDGGNPKMTIREIQKKIAAALNGVEALVQGGCK